MLNVGIPKPISSGSCELNNIHILSLLILLLSGLPIGNVCDITGLAKEPNAYVFPSGPGLPAFTPVDGCILKNILLILKELPKLKLSPTVSKNGEKLPLLKNNFGFDLRPVYFHIIFSEPPEGSPDDCPA